MVPRPPDNESGYIREAIGELRSGVSNLQSMASAHRTETTMYQADAQMYRREVRTELRELRETCLAFAGVVERVGELEKTAADYRIFRKQIGLAVALLSVIMTGAIQLVWAALTHAGELFRALRGLFSSP